ncbi:MAG: alpha/beta fold hydrolase [Pseudomonadota bacterium]
MILRRIVKTTATAVVIGLLGLGLFAAVHWQPDVAVDELADKWAGEPSRFLPVQGMNVHVRDEGPVDSGTTIALIHGTASSLHTWDGWADVLSENHRVVRFDLPGFGLTGPHPADDYSIEAYVEFVVASLDALLADRVVLVGNSLGGHIAWATAVLHPDRIERLVLVDSSGYPPESTSVPIGFRIARTPLLRDLMNNVLPRFIVRSSVENVFGDPSLVTEELIDRYYDLSSRAGNRQALGKRMQQFNSTAFIDRLDEIRQPTLILWGKQDRLIPFSGAERFLADIDDATLVAWEHLGHVPHEEAPAETVAALQTFLRQAGE